MNEVINIKDIKQIENEYMKNQIPFLIEDKILSSFKKSELENMISDIKKEYLKEALPYKHQLAKIIKKQDLNEIEKYFIEQIHFYFGGGDEIDKTKKFLEKLERFYKLNHTNFLKNKEVKQVDINSIPIIEIISTYVKLPGNISRNMNCPLHNDNSPSFHIYEKTNSFYCFGCHKGGNSINFISEIENISIKEAFKKIVTLYSK